MLGQLQKCKWLTCALVSVVECLVITPSPKPTFKKSPIESKINHSHRKIQEIFAYIKKKYYLCSRNENCEKYRNEKSRYCN